MNELERLHRAYVAYSQAAYSAGVINPETMDGYLAELIAAASAHRDSLPGGKARD